MEIHYIPTSQVHTWQEASNRECKGHVKIQELLKSQTVEHFSLKWLLINQTSPKDIQFWLYINVFPTNYLICWTNKVI